MWIWVDTSYQWVLSGLVLAGAIGGLLYLAALWDRALHALCERWRDADADDVADS